MNILNITAIILTYNEEIHIARAIESCKKFCKRVIVIDSFSTDRTSEISEKLGAEVFTNKFVNQAQQFNWALDSIPIDSEWIVRLDADEYFTDELVEEIIAKLPFLPKNVNGVNLKRRHYFMGSWIKHGDRYPLVMMRIFKNGTARSEERWMDEHIVLDVGDSVEFEHDFIDENLNPISWFIDKHNRYASREMHQLMLEKYFLSDLADHENKGVSRSVAVKKWVKDNLYSKIPYFLGPILYFFYRYIFRLGFLDGKSGFVYHFMQGFWYRLLVDVKCLEYEMARNVNADFSKSFLSEMSNCKDVTVAKRSKN